MEAWNRTVIDHPALDKDTLTEAASTGNRHVATIPRAAGYLGVSTPHRLGSNMRRTVAHGLRLVLFVAVPALAAGAFVVLICLPAGCSSADRHRRAEQDIDRVLHEQNEAWNRGNIAGFMRGYWESPKLTFASGGTVTRGYLPTLERYKARYSSKELMGVLTFSDQRIEVLGRDSAMVFGRWRLEREEPIGGLYTLLMRRTCLPIFPLIC